MSTKNDGGPAFPHDGQANYTGGLTLRDYFAAKAMASAWAPYMALLLEIGPPTPAEMTRMREDIAAASYILADVMLEARND